MKRINIRNPGILSLGMAGLMIYMPLAVAGSSPSNEQLLQMVKQQAKQIQHLNERIDKLEHEKPEPAHNPVKYKSKNLSPMHSAGNAQVSGAGRVHAAKYPGGEKQDLAQRVSKLEKDRINVDWSGGGPKISTSDGKHSFKLGGRIQYDFSSTSGSHYDDRNITGSEIRRARLKAQGKIADPVAYMIQVDFANGGASLKNAWLSLAHDFKLGNGTLYFGNILADRGMEAKTSTNWTWFTERSVVANGATAGTPFGLGLTGVFQGKDDWHYSLGLYKGTASKTARKHDSDLMLVSRAHWDPIDTGDGGLLLHVGASGVYERYQNHDNPVQQSVLLGTHYNGNLRIRSDAVEDPRDSYSYTAELAGLAGPFALGAEWGQLFMRSRSHPTMQATGYNIMAGYSLTGQPFGYSTKNGTWTRPQVDHPVFQGGLGTWQLIARYQGLSFQNNVHYHGGSGHGTSVGVNWYLNKLLRTTLEYTHWHTDNDGHPVYASPASFPGDDDGNTVNARLQLVF